MPKHALQKLIEGSDEDFKVRSYSGRGMFGKRCLGIEVDREYSLGDVFAAILEAIANDDCVLNEQGLEEAAEAFRNECICKKCGEIEHHPSSGIDQSEPFLCESCDEEFSFWQNNRGKKSATLEEFLNK